MSSLSRAPRGRHRLGARRRTRGGERSKERSVSDGPWRPGKRSGPRTAPVALRSGPSGEATRPIYRPGEKTGCGRPDDKRTGHSRRQPVLRVAAASRCRVPSTRRRVVVRLAPSATGNYKPDSRRAVTRTCNRVTVGMTCARAPAPTVIDSLKMYPVPPKTRTNGIAMGPCTGKKKKSQGLVKLEFVFFDMPHFIRNDCGKMV